MTIRVLIILAHPRSNSFCGALAAAYKDGAAASGAEIRELVLAQEDFDLNVTGYSPRQQVCEDSITKAQTLISWAEHIVFVYPTWWGTMPALLKGFLDRVMMPGYAFNETAHAGQYEQLLRGRSAQLLVSMDTPPWVYRWIYRQPGHNAMKRATLGFCGIKPTRIASFGPVKDATAGTRQAWLNQAGQLGRELPRWRHAVSTKEKIGAWLSLMRLQFYPMTFIAYSIGALAAAARYDGLNLGVFWLCYLCIFLMEIITVFSNEYFDFASDRLNKNAGNFTGGSRVLVEGRLSFDELRKGVVLISAALLLAGVWLLQVNQAISLPEMSMLLFISVVMTVGYTVPPLKWVYRGLGEINVGLTHSFLVVLCGYAFQSGNWTDPYPWLISMPLFLATLPAITLSAIPDHDADRSVGKRTLAVRFGPRNAALIAVLAAVLAALSGILLLMSGVFSTVVGYFLVLTLPHAAWLLVKIRGYIGQGAPCDRIDGLMTLSLTFVLWFGVIPLVDLLARM